MIGILPVMIIAPKTDIILPKRRQLLLAAAALPLATLFPESVLAEDFWDLPREVWIRRVDHKRRIDETVRAVYWANGALQVDGYKKICHIMRDPDFNQTVAMSVDLLNVFRGLNGWFEAFGYPRPIMLLSGYRTPESNSKIEKAARNSRHMRGEAGDIYMSDIPADYMAKLSKYLAGGGVGFYPDNHFVHVDSGPIRAWKG